MPESSLVPCFSSLPDYESCYLFPRKIQSATLRFPPVSYVALSDLAGTASS